MTDRKKINQLIALGVGMYFASYVTRVNYTAILVEFIRREGVARSAASLITTTAFVTYGLGQLLSGMLGDRISPVKLINGGLLVTITMNVLLPFFAPNIGVMMIIWGINGLAQAFMWPPLVKIFLCALPQEEYGRAISLVGFGSGSGTIIVYLMAPLLIRLYGWRSVFFASALTAALILAVWATGSARLLRNVSFNVAARKKRAHREETESTQDGGELRAMCTLLPIILVAIAIQGMLRDGIMAWVPSFVSDTFALDSSISILTSVVMPIVHLCCITVIYRSLRWLKNDVFACMGLYFGAGLFFLLMLMLFGQANLFLCLMSFAGGNAMLHCVNTVQVSYLPSSFRGLHRDSWMAGLLNFSVYIGSAASTYLFAVLSEKYGWGLTVWTWVFFCAVGLGIAVFCMLRMRRLRSA